MDSKKHNYILNTHYGVNIYFETLEEAYKIYNIKPTAYKKKPKKII